MRDLRATIQKTCGTGHRAPRLPETHFAFRDSITSSEDQPASPERGWLVYLSSPLTPIWAWARGRGYCLEDLDGGYARALTREVAINLGRDAGGKAQHRTECQRDGCEHDC